MEVNHFKHSFTAFVLDVVIITNEHGFLDHYALVVIGDSAGHNQTDVHTIELNPGIFISANILFDDFHGYCRFSVADNNVIEVCSVPFSDLIID